MNKWICLALFVNSLIVSGFAQVPFAKIEVHPSSNADVECSISGDSILIGYNYARFIPKRTLWIASNGTQKEAEFGELDENRELLAVLADGSVTKYYFTETDNKRQVIKCLVFDQRAGTKTWISGDFPIEGILLGHYFDDGLHLISVLPRENTLKIVRMKDLRIVSEKVFTLTAPLLKHKRVSVAFIEEGKLINSAQASASVKILKTDSSIIITADEPYDDFDKEHFINRTNIFHLDLASGRVANQYIVEQSSFAFNSIVFKGNLYRILQSRKPLLQIFNLKTGTKSFSLDLSSLKNIHHFGYSTNSEKRTIKKDDLKALAPYENYVIPSMVGDDIVLQVGARYPIKHMAPTLVGFGLAGLMVSAVTNTIIRSTPSQHATDSYYFLVGSPQNGFLYTGDSKTLSQQISEHEMKVNYVKYIAKIHLYSTDDTAYGVYLPYKGNEIEIIKFQNVPK